MGGQLRQILRYDVNKISYSIQAVPSPALLVPKKISFKNMDQPWSYYFEHQTQFPVKSRAKKNLRFRAPTPTPIEATFRPHPRGPQMHSRLVL